MYFCVVLKKLSVWFLGALALAACGGKDVSSADPILYEGVIFRGMPAQPLPPLHIPRMAHSLFLAGDQLVVIGGHTTGFIPTRTAEYLSGDKWVQVETNYTHDNGFAVMSKGRPMVGGGYEGDFGIGQSWGTELFDPSTHTFTHLPILDRKRTHASALEMEDGSVLVSGNWYAPDNLELFTPGAGFQVVKEVAQHRNLPFILKSAPDNALVFSCAGHYGDSLKPVVIDRLNGDPFTAALLDEWRPAFPHHNLQSQSFEVGNYSYLIPASNAAGQIAPILVSGESFTLMETEQPIPMEGPWGPIGYDCQFFTDKEHGIAWLLGVDFEDRVYLLKIGYLEALRGERAPITLYFTQPIEQLWWSPAHTERKPEQLAAPRGILLDDNRFAIIGGGGGYSQYDPTPVACILCPYGKPSASRIAWWAIALVILGLSTLALLLWRRFRAIPKNPGPAIPEEDLLSRLTDLMENKQFFRRKDAKLTLVATELGTNVTYVSAVVNGTTGMNFPTFLNSYRIRFSQQLMREHPELPLHQIAEESGFPNETTFLRNFKALTGKTPTEWKRSNLPNS